MHFTKMHGIGNDYVYVDCTREQVRDPEAVAKYVSDRHFGIGSDGLILIKPTENADFEMDMYNADGSRGKMCGNGIRCVGKYVYDHGLTDKTTVKIATGAGPRILKLTVEDGKVVFVRVNMGHAILRPEDIPVPRTTSSAVFPNAPRKRYISHIPPEYSRCTTSADLFPALLSPQTQYPLYRTGASGCEDFRIS